MSPPRTVKPLDHSSPSPKVSLDPYLDFPKESDLYSDLYLEPSRKLSAPRESTPVRPLTDGGPNTSSANIPTAPKRTKPFTLAAIGIGLLVGLIISGTRYGPKLAWPARLGAAPAPVVSRESTATLTSTPGDADVYIDGVHAGRTPISLSLPVGVRVAELRRGLVSSRVPLDIEAGKITAQHVDFAAGPLTGGLEVTSDPLGARVSIDGMPLGQTPLTIPEFAPGQHRVTISSGRASVERTVAVTAGAMATVVVVWQPESTAEQSSLRRPAPQSLPPTETQRAAPDEAIYTALDRDVTPPVELEQRIPAWNPPAQDASRWFRGVVQVVIDERGSVESARLVWPLADFYDAGLLDAARGWHFKPATRAGQPVKYRKIVEITMRPQQ